MAADKMPESGGNVVQVSESFKEKIIALGAKAAAVIAVKDISFDAAFRSMCASNACGNYGRSYMCPPDIGEIEALIREAKRYFYALVYQTVGFLEDSYDFEGMMEAGRHHNDLAQRVRRLFEEECGQKALHLGTGGCRLCPVCGKKTGEPCPFSRPSDVISGGLWCERIGACGTVRHALYQRGKYGDLFWGSIFLGIHFLGKIQKS